MNFTTIPQAYHLSIKLVYLHGLQSISLKSQILKMYFESYELTGETLRM
jgi:hypothetical protein